MIERDAHDVASEGAVSADDVLDIGGRCLRVGRGHDDHGLLGKSCRAIVVILERLQPQRAGLGTAS